jgi:hypothetical protein
MFQETVQLSATSALLSFLHTERKTRCRVTGTVLSCKDAINGSITPYIRAASFFGELSIIFYLHRVQTNSGAEQTSAESITGLQRGSTAKLIYHQFLHDASVHKSYSVRASRHCGGFTRSLELYVHSSVHRFLYT